MTKTERELELEAHKKHGFRTVKDGGLSYCYECLKEKYGGRKGKN